MDRQGKDKCRCTHRARASSSSSQWRTPLSDSNSSLPSNIWLVSLEGATLSGLTMKTHLADVPGCQIFTTSETFLWALKCPLTSLLETTRVNDLSLIWLSTLRLFLTLPHLCKLSLIRSTLFSCTVSGSVLISEFWLINDFLWLNMGHLPLYFSIVFDLHCYT